MSKITALSDKLGTLGLMASCEFDRVHQDNEKDDFICKVCKAYLIDAIDTFLDTASAGDDFLCLGCKQVKVTLVSVDE